MELKKHYFLLAAILLLAQTLGAQIRKGSLDIGIDGYYNTSSLTISLGGNSIGGGLQRANLNSQLGYFLFDNFAIGGRYFKSYENFWVERQHFNSLTGQYEPYRQIEDAHTYGAYVRYYLDFSPALALFGHGEVGSGKERISYTEEDPQGGIKTNTFNRDIGDLGISVGLALRPSPNIGLEFQAMRRFIQESYDPRLGTGQPLTQVESYDGYEFRIGARINFDLVGGIRARGAKKLRPF